MSPFGMNCEVVTEEGFLSKLENPFSDNYTARKSKIALDCAESRKKNTESQLPNHDLSTLCHPNVAGYFICRSISESPSA